jgi:hypothetical protein
VDPAPSPNPTVLRLSGLGHTWLIDVDGVILSHNGHLHGDDRLLPGAHELWASIPESDCIVVLSARGEEHRAPTLAFLDAQGLRVDRALFGLPFGERVLINDMKPSGLKTALAVNLVRDAGLSGLAVEIAPEL